MSNLWVFGFFDDFFRNQFFKDSGDCLFEFLLNKALNRSARHTFGGTTSAFSFLAFLFLLLNGLAVDHFVDFNFSLVDNWDVGYLHLWDLLLL